MQAKRAASPASVDHAFDIILDPVGASTLDDDLRALAIGGRLVVIGLLSGRSAELDLGRLMTRRLRIVGSVLRSRPIAEKARLCRALRDQVWPLIASGAIRPVVHAVYPIAQVDRAHAELAGNATIGKVLLAVRAARPG